MNQFLLLASSCFLAITSACFATSSIKSIIGEKSLDGKEQVVKGNWTNNITYETLSDGMVHIAHYPNKDIVTYLDGDHEGLQSMIDSEGYLLEESTDMKIESNYVVHYYKRKKVTTNKHCQFFKILKNK